MVSSLPCVHIHLYLPIEKDICVCRMYQLSFLVFICAFHPEISSFFRLEFPLSIPIFVLNVDKS